MSNVYELFDTFNYPHWHSKALCRDPKYDQDWWMPISSKAQKLALATCNECPVRQQCLEWILSIEQAEQKSSTGIYGGLTEKQRRRIRWCHLKGCKKRPANKETHFCSEEHHIEHKRLNHAKYNALHRYN